MNYNTQRVFLHARRGFSLLEVTIALSISGFLFSAIWQLTATSGQQREAAALSSQAMLMTAAAKDYINGQSTALLALPALASLDAVARVKITDTDTGDAATSVQGAGYLPQSFVNQNSYGQSYALFVKREDAGSPGVADNGDRVIGLLVTTGGTAISDQMGARVAGSMGAAGGFLYAEGNPASPAAATTARGAAGGWQVNLTSTGWSSIGSVAQAGRLAALVNLLPSGMGVGGSGGASVSALDDLDDAKTDYSSGLNLYVGAHAGDNIASGGQNNSGVGINALRNATTGDNNIALGMNSGQTVTTGSNNIAIGAGADFVDGTVSNQLNIGNTLYGNLSTKQINIGSPIMVTGIGFDIGGNTSASRLSVGTNAQRPACTADLNGAQRVNSQTQTVELCVGGAWMMPSPAWTPAAGQPTPNPTPGSGYFVLSESTWDGNLGGFSGANAKCLTELTTKTNWMYYSTANAAGQLVADKVKAFICIGRENCNLFMPGATYYYARVGDDTVGGGFLNSQLNQSAVVGTTSTWSASNFFGGDYSYWTGRDSGPTGTIPTGGPNHTNYCDGFYNNSNARNGQYGMSNSSTSTRWYVTYGGSGCDASMRLVCMVHP